MMEQQLSRSTHSGSQPTHTQKARQRLFWATVITLVLSFVPYAEVVLYPLRLFVTFIHECGHALAALAIGGQVQYVQVSPNGEGVTPILSNSNLWAWVFISAGYLSTAFLGAVMLQVGRMRRWRNPGRSALYLTAGFVLLATLLWVAYPMVTSLTHLNPLALNNSFTLLVGLGLTVVLWALARFTSAAGAEFVTAFLAVQMSLNALSDLRILLHLTTSSSRANDAVLMERIYLLPAPFWAVLWGILALVFVGFSLRSFGRAR